MTFESEFRILRIHMSKKKKKKKKKKRNYNCLSRIIFWKKNAVKFTKT